MDFDKFTERARGFVQAAQTIATRDYNQQITPEHLLKAFLDDEEGTASALIRLAGGDAAIARQANDVALGRLPKVRQFLRPGSPAFGDRGERHAGRPRPEIRRCDRGRA
jgi:ATP-dependent Clp protease ATP-binding subunit ClpA